MEMKTGIGVTGASGFLGYNLCRDLSEKFDVFPIRHKESCDSKNAVHAIELPDDLDGLDRLHSENKFKFLVHAAAWADADLCEKYPDTAYKINVKGTMNIAEFCKSKDINLIYISTDLVYGSGYGKHNESQAFPTLTYSKTKYTGEKYVLSVDGIVLRCALIYGPNSGERRSFLGKMHKKILKGETLNLFSDQYRTPIWSCDISMAISLIIEKGISCEVFNLGGPDRLTRYDFAKRAAKILGWPDRLLNPIEMKALKHLADRPFDCSLDSRKAISMLKWRNTTVNEGIRQFRGSLLNNGAVK